MTTLTNLPKVLITGASGQLGFELQHSNLANQASLIPTDYPQLDITNLNTVESFFAAHQPNVCINAAAFTGVDKAEEEDKVAFKVNAEGVKNLAIACKNHQTKLIHISTDFVFDGTKSTPYLESDPTSPINVYGKSKLEGEKQALAKNPETLILRTSWLYSSHGNNFVKTMIRLGKEKEKLNVVADQIGTPTYAADLADIISDIILKSPKTKGIYHFSNQGVASWYDFAHNIFSLTGIDIDLQAIRSKEFKTAAKRPHFSVLDKGKIKNDCGITPRHWQEALKDCLDKIDF